MERDRKILRLLQDDARLTADQIAGRLGITPDEAREAVASLEARKAILAYKAIVNPEAADADMVEAVIDVKVRPKRGLGFHDVARRIARFPEVKSLYLMSGGSDLMVFIQGRSLKEIASFVTDTLATLEDVEETVSHFALKLYKKDGILIEEDGSPGRLPVTP
ncbi:MAG: Lrp/AsnC family transcriptional regulator [Candidatus Sumerlaeaceae bacterium]|nr:Lrp/AsnC family transcriptional regulator [Candidatus Sumerlaeaceae bacterium]